MSKLISSLYYVEDVTVPDVLRFIGDGAESWREQAGILLITMKDRKIIAIKPGDAILKGISGDIQVTTPRIAKEIYGQSGTAG